MAYANFRATVTAANNLNAAQKIYDDAFQEVVDNIENNSFRASIVE